MKKKKADQKTNGAGFIDMVKSMIDDHKVKRERRIKKINKKNEKYNRKAEKEIEKTKKDVEAFNAAIEELGLSK